MGNLECILQLHLKHCGACSGLPGNGPTNTYKISDHLLINGVAIFIEFLTVYWVSDLEFNGRTLMYILFHYEKKATCRFLRFIVFFHFFHVELHIDNVCA